MQLKRLLRSSFENHTKINLKFPIESMKWTCRQPYKGNHFPSHRMAHIKWKRTTKEFVECFHLDQDHWSDCVYCFCLLYFSDREKRLAHFIPLPIPCAQSCASLSWQQNTRANLTPITSAKHFLFDSVTVLSISSYGPVCIMSFFVWSTQCRITQSSKNLDKT